MLEYNQIGEIDYATVAIFIFSVGIFFMLYLLGKKDEKINIPIYASDGTIYATAKVGSTTEMPTKPTLKLGGTLGGV